MPRLLAIIIRYYLSLSDKSGSLLKSGNMPPYIETKVSIKDKVKVRPMGDADFNFIINSWLKTYKYSGPAVKRMLDRVYFETYEPIVKTLIRRSDVYVACLRDDPEIIVGYLAIERTKNHDVIHFCLVKDLWQKMGVATYLIEAADPRPDTYFTHWTNPIQSIINKVTYLFNPFLITKE